MTNQKENIEENYLDLLEDIMENGSYKGDRTGVGTQSVFGRQLLHRMSCGFPLLTTKKVHWKSVAYELLWMLKGQSNIKYLQDNGVTIWDEWADEKGELGPVYGTQWRYWHGRIDPEYSTTFHPSYKIFDQIKLVTDSIRNNPDSRRHIVTAWNPGEVDEMKLPPCHMMFQFYVDGEYLSLHMYQRSADVFLGVPFNIASYALLLEIMSHIQGLQPGELIISFGDVHIYNNHRGQVNTQLAREPKPLPSLIFNCEPKEYPWEYSFEDFSIRDYNHHEAIKAPVAI